MRFEAREEIHREVFGLAAEQIHERLVAAGGLEASEDALEFRRTEVPEPNGPQGRAEGPTTVVGPASWRLFATAGTTRDSEPAAATARTRPWSRTRSRLSHEEARSAGG